MGQNFCPSSSDSAMFCPITCIFLARRSWRSKAMSSSVTVGLMTLSTVTLCCEAAALAPAHPPPNAVATSMPARNAPANPAAPVILSFIIFLLTLSLPAYSTSANDNRERMLIQLGREWRTTSGKRRSTPDEHGSRRSEARLQIDGCPANRELISARDVRAFAPEATNYGDQIE